MTLEEIKTVKDISDTWCVNGNIFTPKDNPVVMEWIANTSNTVEPQFTAEELQAQALSRYTSITTNFIQDLVASYNKEHGVAFSDIHNCESYSRADGYTHQSFCLSAWNWSWRVWEAVRALTAMPTDEEFEVVLRSVTDIDLQARIDLLEVRF